jgi:hypothetical protein
LHGEAEVGAAGDHGRKAVLSGVVVRLAEALGPPVRAAEGVDPALLFVLVEDLDDGADRDRRVVAVEEVEVYVVEPQTGQRIVEVARDIEGGYPLAVLVVVGALADHHDRLAQAAVLHPPAESPLAVASAVLMGRIERGAALCEDLIEQREAPLLLPFFFGTDHYGALHDPRHRLIDARHPSVVQDATSSPGYLRPHAALMPSIVLMTETVSCSGITSLSVLPASRHRMTSAAS